MVHRHPVLISTVRPFGVLTRNHNPQFETNAARNPAASMKHHSAGAWPARGVGDFGVNARRSQILHGDSMAFQLTSDRPIDVAITTASLRNEPTAIRHDVIGATS